MRMFAKRIALVAVLAVAVLLCGAPTLAAAADVPVYKPPPRGAPTGRVGLGTRGVQPPPQIWALAPNHTGLTTREQPSLYWYVSRPAAVRIEITAASDKGVTTILETRVAGPAAGGVQKIDLARHGVRLQPGIEYRWSAILESDPPERSNSAAIERVAASPELAQRLAAAPRAKHAAVYAEQGLWYDAIASLSELIDQSPEDLALRAQRAALLEQVGLKAAAAGDVRR